MMDRTGDAMSFRRNREADLAWDRWVRTHSAELVEIGIPREVWSDKLTWVRFLEYATHPPADSARNVRFRLTDLSPEQQLRLYQLLEVEPVSERAGNIVWVQLQAKFGSESQTIATD